MSRPPDRRRSPRVATPEGQSVESPSHVTDKPTIAAAPDGGVCPRCGIEFGKTTDEVLEHCTELARRGAA